MGSFARRIFRRCFAWILKKCPTCDEIWRNWLERVYASYILSLKSEHMFLACWTIIGEFVSCDKLKFAHVLHSVVAWDPSICPARMWCDLGEAFDYHQKCDDNVISQGWVRASHASYFIKGKQLSLMITRISWHHSEFNISCVSSWFSWTKLLYLSKQYDISSCTDWPHKFLWNLY